MLILSNSRIIASILLTLFIALTLALASCASSTPVVLVVTATPDAFSTTEFDFTLVPVVTSTVALTASPEPTRFGGAAGRLAFLSTREGNEEIYLMNASDGSQCMNLTNSSATDNAPDWSPDGTRLLFVSNRDGNSEIYAMNANGAYPTRLTNHPATDDSPAWSPDGKQIAFVSNRDGNNEIYVMNVDGSNPVRLTNNTASDSQPIWSPGSDRLVFTSDRDGNNEIYVMNANGSQALRLTNNKASDWFPAWSPRGDRLAFVSFRDGNLEIYAMNADGSQQTRLTNTNGRDFAPAWSPDGTWIAFNSERDGNFELYLMRADGSQQTRLTTNIAYDAFPKWQPLGGGMRALDVVPTPLVPNLPPTIIWTATATATPTGTISSSVTLTPTMTATVQPSPTMTRTPMSTGAVVGPTVRVLPTSTPNIPPGIYVTAITTDPAEPKGGQGVTFRVSFLNSTTQTRHLRWYVRIFEPDKRQAFGETAKIESDLSIGATQFATGNDWRVTRVGACMPFIARVFSVDGQNNLLELFKPDGASPARGFSVCP